MKTKIWLTPLAGFMVLGGLLVGCDKPAEEPTMAPDVAKSAETAPVGAPVKPVVEHTKMVGEAKPGNATKLAAKPMEAAKSETPKHEGDKGVTETVKEGAESTKAGAEKVGALADKAGEAAGSLPGAVGEKAKAAAVATKAGAEKVKAGAEAVKGGIEKADSAVKGAGDALKGAGDAAKGLLGGK